MISGMLSRLAENDVSQVSVSPQSNSLSAPQSNSLSAPQSDSLSAPQSDSSSDSASFSFRDKIREAIKSGLIPPEIEQDQELLQQFALSLLGKLRGFGSDLKGADGLDAINKARSSCNDTTVHCDAVIDLLQARFAKRCESHCSCRLELTMYPRWVVSTKSMDRVDELRKLQTEIERRKSLCGGARTCLEGNETEHEKAAAERREIPEQLPDLRKRLQKHLRAWESCPFGNSFDNCTKAKAHIVNARVKLEQAYNTSISFLMSLNCSSSKYANCSKMVRQEISLLREEQLHNERMLEQVTFLLVDPTVARVNVALYSVLLVFSVGLLAFGAVWDVIKLFKKYTAVIFGLAVVSLLGIIAFSIGGLTGVASVSTYELLLRVKTLFFFFFLFSLSDVSFSCLQSLASQ